MSVQLLPPSPSLLSSLPSPRSANACLHVVEQVAGVAAEEVAGGVAELLEDAVEGSHRSVLLLKVLHQVVERRVDAVGALDRLVEVAHPGR